MEWDTVKELRKKIAYDEFDNKKFRLEMLDTVAAFGFHVGLDTENFEDNFRAVGLEENGGANATYELYCYTKKADMLYGILYVATNNKVVPLKYAWTFKINIATRDFEFHDYAAYDAFMHSFNISHTRAIGKLPLRAYDKHTIYNLPRFVMDEKAGVPSNLFIELIDIIRESNSDKDFICDDYAIWKPSINVQLIRNSLKSLCGDWFSEIDGLPLELAIEIVFSHLSDDVEIANIAYYLQLIDYQNRYDEMKKAKARELIRALKHKLDNDMDK